MSPISGQQFIENAPDAAFWFVAAQLGASEIQIAALTGHSAAEIKRTNMHNGQLLAFPYHNTRGSNEMTMDKLRDLHERWQADMADDAMTGPVTLNHFRQMIDPWMQHDHG